MLAKTYPYYIGEIEVAAEYDIRYTGEEIIKHLKETNDIVILRRALIHEEAIYQLESAYQDCSVHHRREHDVLEPNPETGSSGLTDIVDSEIDYRSMKDYEIRNIYILDQKH